MFRSQTSPGQLSAPPWGGRNAPLQSPPAPQSPLTHEPRPTKPPDAAPVAYGAAFWLSYAANSSLMVSVSLLYRYGDFVHVLGGTELALGLIVGAGTIGSLAMRLTQGAGIDRYGPRRIWLTSLVVIIAMLLAHLAITRVDTPAIYLVRIAYHCGLAGAFGASITYVSQRAPVVRMAEMIGMLGSSGFVGMAIGTWLGDILCSAPKLERWHVNQLFLVAAGLACLSLVCAYLATRGAVRPIRRRRVSMLGLVRRYHPGVLLMIGLTMGVAVNLPSTFLRPYTQQLGITQIGAFFGVYSATAFFMRLTTRRFSARFGTRPTVLMGMTALLMSLLLYLPVRSAWQLVIPGIVAGTGHAMLFPAVVAGASRTFPARHRGLGITLILAMFDLGNLIGMPLAGTIVYLSEQAGLPAYPMMFLSVAGLVVVTGVYFALADISRMTPLRER